MYILFTLLSAMCLACYDVLKKVSLKRSSVYEVLFFYCLFGFAFSLIFSNANFFNVTIIDVLFFFLKSCILVVNWMLVLIATKKLDVAVVTSFSMLNTVFVLFESALLFNEQITWVHLVSLLLMGIGIFLITKLSSDDHKEEKKNHYVYIALLVMGAFLGSCSAMIDKYLISYRGANNANILSWYLMFNSLIYGAIYFIKNKKLDFKKLKYNYFPILVGLAICMADTLYFYAISLDGAQISFISILRKLNVVLATIMASVFLKEKHLIKKIGILLIMLTGVALPIIF